MSNTNTEKITLSNKNYIFIKELVMDYIKDFRIEDMSNKLFCTFSTKDGLEEKLAEINSEYKIMYKKIFVLASAECEEYLCTYNIEIEDTKPRVLPNTILLHRKKETNTLYTINALNVLIKSMNSGILDQTFPIHWKDYQNSVLLTQDNNLRRLNTVIHKIVNV